MRKQQKIWLKEHTSRATLPSMANSEPASGAVQFTNWLRDNTDVESGKAVDIGSGKGRNSVHLAGCGYLVWGLEYVQPAIEFAESLAKKKHVEEKIVFKLTEIDKRWDFSDDFFDVAIDHFSSIDIETKSGRELCRDEMYRTLKPNGYALVAVCSVDDEWEKELIEEFPGPERNSTLWPGSGKFQKDYDEEELREFYSKFEILELKEISKPAHKLGRAGTATNFWVILRKK